jgi:hypothetical protein
MLPATHWTVDGTPVFLSPDWSAQSLANRGFDQMRGRMTEPSWRRLTASGQGSVVAGFTDSGDAIWEGRLSTIPQIVGGEAHFAAQGYYVQAERKDDRLFIQSQDMDIWQPLDGEPFLNSLGNPFYDSHKLIDVQVGNRVQFSLAKDEEVTNGQRDGAAFWAEGVNLGQIKFTMNWTSPDDTNDTMFRLQRATGPTGSATNVNSWNTITGNRSSTKTETIGSPEDMLLLYFEVGTTHTPSSKKKYAATRIVVWSEITTAVSFSAYQVVDYIADTLGWDTTGIVSATYNVLPFDWEDGDWSAAATYVAELEDKQWGVYESLPGGPRCVYDDWGAREWTVYLSGGAAVDLTPLEIYNKAIVWYETPTGRTRQRVSTASPDPLASVGIVNAYEYSLEDRQGGSTLAASVADKLVTRFSRQRYSGKATVVNAFDETGRDNPYGIRPGDTVRIADWAPGEDVTLRVYDVTLGQNSVELGLEEPINLSALLRRRTRRKKKNRR